MMRSAWSPRSKPRGLERQRKKCFQVSRSFFHNNNQIKNIANACTFFAKTSSVSIFLFFVPVVFFRVFFGSWWSRRPRRATSRGWRFLAASLPFGIFFTQFVFKSLSGRKTGVIKERSSLSSRNITLFSPWLVLDSQDSLWAPRCSRRDRIPSKIGSILLSHFAVAFPGSSPRHTLLLPEPSSILRSRRDSRLLSRKYLFNCDVELLTRWVEFSFRVFV